MRILTNVRLSDSQKIVMARAIIAETPQIAYENINEGINLRAAALELHKLGLLNYDADDTYVTESGKDVLRDENIIDETDQLTEDGERYAEMEGPSEIKDDDGAPPEVPPQEEDPMAKELGLPEQWGLLGSIADEVGFEEQLKKLNTV